MDMQDNELDKLFRSALDDLEIEPSARVWTGINSQLNAGKRRRSLMPFLSVAAGIILLITAGLLFMPEITKVNQQQTSANKITENQSVAKSLAVVKARPAVTTANSTNKKVAAKVIASADNFAAVKANKELVRHKAAKTPELKEIMAGSNEGSAPVLASRGNDLINPAAPDARNEITGGPEVDDLAFKGKPQLAAAQLPDVDKLKPAPVKKHRIRSLGDVFNVVIAAVDKREDKIIEFSNTDEDDATITGVNLGIIKVKKEK